MNQEFYRDVLEYFMRKNYIFFSVVYLLSWIIVLSGCQLSSTHFEPCIGFVPSERCVQDLPSSFPPLSPEELKTDWGKEMQLGESFAREFDLYRALTCFKRAKILIPCELLPRRLQIDYDILLCYYLGGKYVDVIQSFESSCLTSVSPAFPALPNLILILYDSYEELGQCEKAEAFFNLIERGSPETAKKLELSEAIIEGDLSKLSEFSLQEPYSFCGPLVSDFIVDRKSVRTAQALNAVLPGAGYAYVGQKKTALTSFFLNALFIAAAYQFFDKGYIAAGIITLSFESGWYFGGINGAGLAAKEYNERLYEKSACEVLYEKRLFPVLMFSWAF